MKKYLMALSLIVVASTSAAQTTPDPFQGNGCWTGVQWVPKSHQLCNAPVPPPEDKLVTSIVPPSVDEYYTYEPYGAGISQRVIVRTADRSLWFLSGQVYRHPYNVEMKIGRTEFRCENIGYGEVCDLFQIGTITKPAGIAGLEEGKEIPFRLFAPMWPWFPKN